MPLNTEFKDENVFLRMQKKFDSLASTQFLSLNWLLPSAIFYSKLTATQNVFENATGFRPFAFSHCLTLNRCKFRLCQLPRAFMMRVCEILEQQDTRASLSQHQRTSFNMGTFAQCLMFLSISVFTLRAHIQSLLCSLLSTMTMMRWGVIAIHY